MDAKVDDWVVTPRRGKAVEINALWYNALRLLEDWLSEEGNQAASAVVERPRESAAIVQSAILVRGIQYLFDVVDGPDGGRSRVPAESAAWRFR